MSKKEQDIEALNDASDAALQLGNQLSEINNKFGNNLPYDLTRIENEIGFLSATGSQVMLEMGKRFILIKEHEQHGSFLESLNRMGYKPRSVQKMMQATLKFSKTPSMAQLGSTKLFELMTEDDDVIEELEEGGTVAGLTLDKIDKMSVSELKAKLREANAKAEEEQEIKEKQLLEKDEKINTLDAELYSRDKKDPTIKESISDNMQRMLVASGQIIDGIRQLQDINDELKLNPDFAGSEDAQRLMGGSMYELSLRATNSVGNHMNDMELEYEHIKNEGSHLLDRWLEEHGEDKAQAK